MNKIRTRFAPSPTGYVHIGNIRSAIYPYLFARQNDGEFLLRIEDTDQKRLVAGATDLVLDTLKWLGLNWDGEPVFQTSRKDIYLKYAQKLLDKGLAYADPFTPEQVQNFREEDTKNKVPFLYRNHRPNNPPAWKEGLPLRFKQTNLVRHNWHDEVMGGLSAGPEVLDDIVLIKADGLPTYNFAHIIDDVEMKITHIFRGVEYLPSMPNYLSLYEALEITPPKFAHLPHILAPSGNKKLSKRDGAKSVTDYRDEGILPEAMLNFLAMLGWNDGTEQEIFSMPDLIEKFQISRIQRSGARFDENKLIWLNGQWIRKIVDDGEKSDSRQVENCRRGVGSTPTSSRTAATAPHEDGRAREGVSDGEKSDFSTGLTNLYNRCKNFWPEEASSYSDEEKKKVLSIVYDRLKTLNDLKILTPYFFADPKINLELITENKFLKNFSENELKSLLQISVEKLKNLESWDKETLQTTLNELLAETNKKPAELFTLIRISVSFAPFSPALPETLETLTKNTTLARLNAVISSLVIE
jgi:glutamyl-tRNA synthetase